MAAGVAQVIAGVALFTSSVTLALAVDGVKSAAFVGVKVTDSVCFPTARDVYKRQPFAGLRQAADLCDV